MAKGRIKTEYDTTRNGQLTLSPAAPFTLELNEEAPWLRAPKETGRQYAMFEAYLRLPTGTRTIKAAWENSGFGLPDKPVPTNVYETSRKFKWASRAVAYDEHLKAKAWAEDEALAVKALKLRNGVLVRGMSKLAEAIDQHNFSATSTGDLARFADTILKQADAAFAPVKETRQKIEVVNGGKSEMLVLADKAAELTDDEVMAEFRRLIPSRNDDAAE